MAFFRRQTEEVSKNSLLPKKSDDNLDKQKYFLTPGRFIFFLISVLLFLLLCYFGLQYRKLQIPPTLTIDSPKDHFVTDSKRMDVIGATDPDATVSINSIGVLVRSDGKFFDQVQLFPGKNSVTVSATSRYGKTTTVVREVTVEEKKNEASP